MARRSTRTQAPLARSRAWLLRGVVLLALVLTLWIAGPGAWQALALRRAAQPDMSPRVTLDRVGFHDLPTWVGDDLLVGILQDLQPRLTGSIGIMDDAAAVLLETSLTDSPWVRSVSLRRRFPDRLVAELELRRPLLSVHEGPDARLQCLVDAEGVCLPPIAGIGLPRTLLANGVAAALEFGKVHGDPRVRASALVAAEWREEIAPQVPGVPDLAEVDASNLNYVFLADSRWSEIRVGLAGRNGGMAYFGYGHPPGCAAPRVASGTKASVLRKVLESFPELKGLRGGDLRFQKRWRDWLIPRTD